MVRFGVVRSSGTLICLNIVSAPLVAGITLGRKPSRILWGVLVLAIEGWPYFRPKCGVGGIRDPVKCRSGTVRN